nr:MAG TPA: hypothetical protein [Caudoviricetes sp.]
MDLNVWAKIIVFRFSSFSSFSILFANCSLFQSALSIIFSSDISTTIILYDSLSITVSLSLSVIVSL